jgi:uridine kinase
MRGDSIVVEPHHRKAAAGVVRHVRDAVLAAPRYTVSIAGESGSGKSETAVALAEALAEDGVEAAILQQDDYFVHPPRSNDRARRDDIAWVGPQEVRLDLLDAHLASFRDGAGQIVKPLVIYEDDRIDEETISVADARVLIAEGTYTTLLDNVITRVFIDRTFEQTRAHREKRSRDAAELDPFIDRVLAIEHDIIAGHRKRAQLIVTSDYDVVPNE